MFTEPDLLLPVGETFLRQEHRADRGLQAYEMDLPTPRDHESSTDWLACFYVDELRSESPRYRHSNPFQNFFHGSA